MFELFTSLVDKFLHITLSVIISGASLLGFSTHIPPHSEPTTSPQPIIEAPQEQEGTNKTSESSQTATTTLQTAQEPSEHPAEPQKTPTVETAPENTDNTPAKTEVYTTNTATENPKTLSTDELNGRARDALVNILCESSGSSGLSASGSGVVIDPRGIILTNAHIAQFLLLEEGPDLVSCTIRTGAPARNAFDAELLYISPQWLSANAASISQDEPLGTGEHDVALLRITKTTDGTALPSTFNFIETAPPEHHVSIGSQAFLAGYPAGFLGGSTIRQDLYPSSAFAHILNMYTFNTRSQDVFSLSGTVLAQRGSSGAGVLDAKTGALIGIVVTSSIAESTNERILNAITTKHIHDSFITGTNVSLSAYISDDPEASADTFRKEVAPTLRELLLREVER